MYLSHIHQSLWGLLCYVAQVAGQLQPYPVPAEESSLSLNPIKNSLPGIPQHRAVFPNVMYAAFKTQIVPASTESPGQWWKVGNSTCSLPQRRRSGIP